MADKSQNSPDAENGGPDPELGRPGDPAAVGDRRQVERRHHLHPVHGQARPAVHERELDPVRPPRGEPAFAGSSGPGVRPWGADPRPEAGDAETPLKSITRALVPACPTLFTDVLLMAAEPRGCASSRAELMTRPSLLSGIFLASVMG